MTKIIACIGSGNMGLALMKGAARSMSGDCSVHDYSIGFTDTDQAKATSAAEAIGASVYASNSAAVSQGDFVFLAVKPQVLAEVLTEIGPTISNRISAGSAPILVSMAAGWSIKRIQTVLAGSGNRVVPGIIRIMPNTPALVGQGIIALASSPEVPESKSAELKQILAGSGLVDTLEEQYLDAVTALSGSGPAFVYVFIEALADGGVRSGLPRDKALRYAVQTLLGATAMVQETGKHPGELKDMVTSPGGTTIAGLAALETGAFRGIVMNAVDAAWKRSKELSSN
ncbi:MAG: pyrroline-5-carboxylate reductase [Treponema sp.]|jgi:pyrroline-5-carboxylate reductase|nr:pyrroline-5-carboxylate reductase [Treponema sp.]